MVSNPRKFAFTFLAYACCSVPAQVSTYPANSISTIAFVGCESQGQGGAINAPVAQRVSIEIPAEVSQRLAYYKAEEGVGVLAPRDWHCFGTYGSNGATLNVSPDVINTKELLSTNWKGFTGPAIQISSVQGDTSGRFQVAKTIARVFPGHKAFVQAVIAEGIEPASSFPSRPYPRDIVKRRTNNIVEFLTPAHADGLGTASRLQKNDSPIRGVVILFGEEPNLLQLSVRLRENESDLTQFIIQWTEREAVHLDATGDRPK